MSKSKDNFISFDEASGVLGLLNSDFQKWVEKDKPEIGEDYIHKLSIRKSYLEECAHKEDYLAKLERSFQAEIRELENESESKIAFYKKERSSLIKLYEGFLSELQTLHEKYREIAESHGLESSVFAAYLLFSKAIAIANCLCENLKHGYWYVGSMMREIDETLDVGLYFVIMDGTAIGKSDLWSWFRLGASPQHAKCRKAISEWNSKIDPSIDQNSHQLLMIGLYGMKSKFTHPTFNPIRECGVMSVMEGIVSVKELCYGKSCRQKRLWELTHFIKSSIWTCFQQFFLTFMHAMPLKQEDIDYLLAYYKMFMALDSALEW